MPAIGNAIGIPFKRGGVSWSSYWLTRYISGLSVLTTGATTQTVTATIVGTGHDGVSFEYSTDLGVTWSAGITDADGVLNQTGLISNTLYYWRARLYKGTHYGDYSDVEYDATTGTKYLYDIDGNAYPIIIIGTQIWMGKNLAVTKYRYGLTSITNVTLDAAWAALGTEAYCWQSNDIGNKDPYGALYNHFAVRDANSLAPIGWHIPTRAEFQALSTALGGDTISGGKLKEVGTTHWSSPNVGANNSSGFTAVAGGDRLDDGTFRNTKDFGEFWTSTLVAGINYYLNFLYSLDDDCRNDFDNPQKIGYSVRCVSDYTSPLSAFKMAGHSDLALATMRTTLITAIWPGGYPATGKDSITTGVAEPMASSASNLASIDKLSFTIAGITAREPYVWHPTVSNNKFVIWHLGHFDPGTGTDIWEQAGEGDMIRALIEEGYTVCGTYMPPDNAGTEGRVHSYPTVAAPYQNVADLHYFLETSARILNEYAGQFSAYYMGGLSGGGWTTIMVAAIDERITKSAQVSGTLPLCATDLAGMGRDWEQHLSTLSASVDYGDLFVMGCTNNRVQRHFLNVIENGNSFDLATYNIVPYKNDFSTKTGGRGTISWDNSGVLHEVRTAVIPLIVEYFNS